MWQTVEPFKILSNERVILAGMTGSGKTYLARHLLARQPRLIAVDPKGTMSDKWPNLTEANRETTRALLAGEPARVWYRPDNRRDWADVCQGVWALAYEAGDVTVYIDELFGVGEDSSRPSPAFNALYTRGRELGIGVWAATQRPVFVPLVTISESEHRFVFYLQLPDDRKRMSAFMGEEVLSPIEDRHGFWYSRAFDRHPRYFRGI